ncbi:MAG TPA: dihydroorotate dehydrogenase [Planctomycetota bacterium]|nr:dihydroorotate dehydrogenase [Planctomycetota bacterium]
MTPPTKSSPPPAAPAITPQSVDLSVRLGPLELRNPLMTASGTAGLGLEMEPFWDLSVAGAVVVKTLTMKPRRGNPMPRLCETPSGLLNSIGLPNKGLPHFLREVLPRLAGKADCLVVNIAGTCTGEFGEMAAMLDGAEGVDALELNVSCPNVDGGDLPFGRDPQVVYRLVGDVRAATRLPVITKLTPNVSDIVAVARAAHEAGSDAVSVINTLLGLAVDWRSGRPGLRYHPEDAVADERIMAIVAAYEAGARAWRDALSGRWSYVEPRDMRGYDEPVRIVREVP